jgi:hypothetical protein
MRSLTIAVFLSAVAAVPLASAAARHAAKYPGSIAVLGTATANGWQSNPAHPFQIAPENSWATGTNPAVKSIYSRILALNPAIKGRNVNLTLSDNALAGAGHELDDFAAEVQNALHRRLKPDLVLVQVIDRAVKCDGTTERDFARYGAKFSESLDALAQGLPNAKIFVISQWGSFGSYVRYLKSLDAHKERLKNAGKKPCQLVSYPSGEVVASRVAYTKSIVAGEEAQLKAACAKVANCRYDGGAASRIAIAPLDVANFQYTPTIQGQAKLAAVEWKALERFLNLR